MTKSIVQSKDQDEGRSLSDSSSIRSTNDRMTGIQRIHSHILVKDDMDELVKGMVAMEDRAPDEGGAKDYK